ncbi:MAG: hypothetical protein HQ556_11675 [Candidatus Marinimicrobia bacterium]|nr:hypothetical protein [Candidatus Neomarinimicrobiota bacterium]
MTIKFTRIWYKRTSTNCSKFLFALTFFLHSIANATPTETAFDSIPGMIIELQNKYPYKVTAISEESGDLVLLQKYNDTQDIITYFDSDGVEEWQKIVKYVKEPRIDIAKDGSYFMLKSPGKYIVFDSTGTEIHTFNKYWAGYQLSPTGDFVIEHVTEKMDQLQYYTREGVLIVPDVPTSIKDRRSVYTFTATGNIVGFIPPGRKTLGGIYLYNPHRNNFLWYLETLIPDGLYHGFPNQNVSVGSHNIAMLIQNRKSSQVSILDINTKEIKIIQLSALKKNAGIREQPTFSKIMYDEWSELLTLAYRQSLVIYNIRSEEMVVNIEGHGYMTWRKQHYLNENLVLFSSPLPRDNHRIELINIDKKTFSIFQGNHLSSAGQFSAMYLKNKNQIKVYSR